MFGGLGLKRRAKIFGFRVWSLGFKVWDLRLGFKVWVQVRVLGFGVWGFGLVEAKQGILAQDPRMIPQPPLTHPMRKAEASTKKPAN